MIAINKDDLRKRRSVSRIIEKTAHFSGKEINTAGIKSTKELSQFLLEIVAKKKERDFFLILEKEETTRLMAMSCLKGNRIMLSKEGRPITFLGKTKDSFTTFLNAVLCKTFYWNKNFRRHLEFSALILVDSEEQFNQRAQGNHSVGYVAIGFQPETKKSMPLDALDFVGIEILSRM
jgi:hypothetical protein